MNWDDLRIFLALARYKTLTATAHYLNVSHSTVSRRLELFSSQTGAQLFRKTPEGFVLTVAGEALLPVAEKMEAEAVQAERLLVGRDSRLSGRLVLSTLDGLLELYATELKSFQQRYPDVALVLRIDNQPANLGRREADVVLRAANSPPEHLVGRRLQTLRWAPFASQELVSRLGSEASYHDYDWIRWAEEVSERQTESWYQKHVGKQPVLRVDVSRSMGVMAQQGVGAVLLPSVVGRLWGLEQIGPVIEELKTDVWALTHPDLQHTARVKALIQTLARHDDDEMGSP